MDSEDRGRGERSMNQNRKKAKTATKGRVVKESEHEAFCNTVQTDSHRERGTLWWIGALGCLGWELWRFLLPPTFVLGVCFGVSVMKRRARAAGRSGWGTRSRFSSRTCTGLSAPMASPTTDSTSHPPNNLLILEHRFRSPNSGVNLISVFHRMLRYAIP